MNMYIFRILQRCICDIVLSKYQFMCILALLFVIFTFSHIGEVLSKLMSDKNDDYSYCGEPIDVIYTWVNGTDPKFKQALKNYLENSEHITKDYSEERFDDKYELKFSLRSLEKYAPWVNHVYIVTNGQIPYWLNLDYEKVTIVSHDELFIDLNNLPTFSSPAIESNIHRIPGLSKKFIYFNDDIFLGAPIYPEDFVTSSQGYLIYLSWPLPSCVPNCPWAYVGDGQCDSSCFHSECQFDGGDCSENSEKLNLNSHNLNSHHEEESEEVKNPVEYDYYDEDKRHYILKREVLRLSPVKHNDSHFESNITTVTSVSSQVYTKKHIKTFKNLLINNSVSDVVNNHNKNIILNDKLRRKKRLYGTLHKRKRYYKNVFNSTISNTTYTKYERNNRRQKHNSNELDTFALSLQHTHRVYNIAYGYKARKVPTHSPILIEKSIMKDLQMKFRDEFEQTRKNRIRSANDMQFSFSYYYYVINEKLNINVSQIFDQFDTDGSNTLSDREIRTILTRINELPLNYGMVELFDTAIINCSKTVNQDDVTVPPYERYIDSKLPVVSKKLILNCPFLIDLLVKNFGVTSTYKYEIVKNAQSQFVMFKMLTSNISDVVGHLDEIRKEPRKFVCLNDNMDPKKTEDNELVKAILLDFYISFFPKPSKFELSQEFRNRFLYVTDLNEWKQYHIRLKLFLLIVVILFCSFSVYSVCKRKLLRQLKKIIYFYLVGVIFPCLTLIRIFWGLFCW